MKFIRTIVQPDEDGGSGYPIGKMRRSTHLIPEFFQGEPPPELSAEQVSIFKQIARMYPGAYVLHQPDGVFVKIG